MDSLSKAGRFTGSVEELGSNLCNLITSEKTKLCVPSPDDVADSPG